MFLQSLGNPALLEIKKTEVIFSVFQMHFLLKNNNIIPVQKYLYRKKNLCFLIWYEF